ncbi:MAG: threonylcarbamoyl-AMP synthase [Betaproteobacteria bacterium RIFCSPLOWO2_02_FULL_63_19]|nr:MAG: threonylcarbamoyl-AMP synthase [Betaproteobacteria bacterium RIFCSPLOWO2_02_FULL_63_19]OGA78358.1 MAG: threonylcarbamoyl-AMP synthase [Betaproteobacteria bacterium RIFCSPLOWO2_12_FULL_65_14]
MPCDGQGPMAMMPSSAEIERAAAILRGGGLVAFPTETVYGLGADARNPEAVARIFEVKGRPQDHPLIVHLPGTGHLDRWAREVPALARTLARAFWPGPLTLIVERAQGVPDAVTGGQNTVGLRVPSHPVAQALLRAFAGEEGERRFDGVAAPSANRFGRISPTTAAHVRADLGGDVAMILDGGACAVGIESTIVDCSRGDPVLLRPGAITAEQIALAAGIAPRPADAEAPRAPGALASHYAPSRPLMLIAAAQWDSALAQIRARRAVLSLREQPPGDTSARWIQMSSDAVRAGHDLYADLRVLDGCDCELILVEAPPPGPQWDGVRDRLSRAATRS